jgi:cell wall-associated protease
MIQKSISKLSILSVALLLGMHMTSASAAIIAIADSGTDVGHPELSKKLWSNPGELDNAVDNDDDGKIGDVHGWNFIDQNNHYYNQKLVGTFPQDVYTFFEVQTRQLLGTATAADKAWINAHRGDKAFLASLNNFGEFVHGTHVAGISSKNADGAQVMALKVIGKKTATLFELAAKAQMGSSVGSTGISPFKDKAIRFGLDYLAKAQGQMLGPVGQYIDQKHAQVVNCSFGASTSELGPTLKPLLQKLIKGITDEQVATYVNYLVSQMVNVMEREFVLAAPHALFVIAAGNDGTNNDELPASPANVRTDNAITVAATVQNHSLAYFSNFGNAHVDIAAPGVGILSTTPGNTHLLLSGTSQATPAVTNIAGQILDANPKLSPGEVKTILMDTVDHQTWLVGKVKSEGTLNGSRAVYAAKQSVSMSLTAAISAAMTNVPAETPIVLSGAPGFAAPISKIDERAMYVVPLPQLIQ